MIRDLMLFIFFGSVLAFLVLGMYIAWSETNDALQGSDLPTDTKTFFNEQTENYENGWDYVYMTVLISIFLGVLILSYFVSSTPVLFWVMWLVVMILSSVAGYLSNAYAAALEEPALAASASHFPMMSFTMAHYLEVVVVLGMLMLLIFFAKPSDGGYA